MHHSCSARSVMGDGLGVGLVISCFILDDLSPWITFYFPLPVFVFFLPNRETERHRLKYTREGRIIRDK